jgi:hypothetical protein
MKRVLLALLLSCLAITSVRADLAWYEGFQYPNGAIETNSIVSPGVTNWICHSPATPLNDALVVNDKLQIGTSSSRQDDIHRFLVTTAGSSITNPTANPVMYASMTVNFSSLPSANGAYFAHFYTPSGGFISKLWALTGNASGSNIFVGPAGTYRLGVSASGSSSPSAIYPVDLATNTDYQVVMAFDQTANRATYLWINPVSSADCNVNTTDPQTVSIPAAFAFRQATGFGPVNANIPYCTFSNLSIATTYAEAATTTVWPTTPTAPYFVYQPQNTTNFVGAATSLTGVASGQSLCSLQYQWIKNGTPISGATSNVFTLASPATTDAGSYSLIVSNPATTLAATSTVVYLAVLDIPVPPQICGQPANTTVFNGQTVQLSVCANGTPPIVYQWYYNTLSNYSGSAINEVTVGTNDTGETTATLSIANVRPGNTTTGYYYCHLTAPNLLTTNTAIVQVSAMPPVTTTIYALRGMVDPVFFLPTNTTTYFSVTGTVISKTNMTTTASSEFFIQDATGGIAVFIGGGAGVVPNPGDNVTVTGPVGNYNSLMEFNLSASNPGHTVVFNHSGSLPPGQVLPISFTNSAAYGGISNAFRLYQGSLLTFTNVSFPAALTNGAWAGGTTYAMVDSSGAVMPLYVYSGFADLIGQPIPAFCWRVTGPMSFYLSTTATDRSAGYQFEPSKPEDFITTPPLPVDVVISLNGSGQPVLTWTAEPFVSYTVLRSATLSPNLADYHAVASGLTFATTAGQYTDTNVLHVAPGYYKVTSP